MKTICIYHSVDLDGWMSAAIVKLWYLTEIRNSPVLHPEIVMLGYNYGDTLPVIPIEANLILVDISFTSEVMESLSKRYDLVWLDHHISAIKKVEGGELIKGKRDIKKAACELTWEYFFLMYLCQK